MPRHGRHDPPVLLRVAVAARSSSLHCGAPLLSERRRQNYRDRHCAEGRGQREQHWNADKGLLRRSVISATWRDDLAIVQ